MQFDFFFFFAVVILNACSCLQTSGAVTIGRWVSGGRNVDGEWIPLTLGDSLAVAPFAGVMKRSRPGSRGALYGNGISRD